MTTAAPAAAGDATPQAASTASTATPAATTATAGAAATTAAPATTDPQTATTAGGQGEGKAGEGKPDGSGTPEVPEKYELAAPEGIELEAAAVTEFSALAKDLKLSQADAQKLADVAVKWQQRQLEAHANTVKGWVEQSKTDKDFGGDAFDKNLAVAQKAIETFGTPGLKEMLNVTGFGNHPEVIRAFYNAGKAISEGKFVASGSRSATPSTQNIAQSLYPNMNP